MIETSRLKIHVASQQEMEAFIASQTEDVLILAYSEMLEGCLQHPRQWEWYAIWMIECKKDNAHIGNLCFKGLADNGSVEIGYGIEEAYQGQGYATEAVSAVVDWAIKQPLVQSIEAETEPDNIASQKVLAKCGFVATGIQGEEGPRFRYEQQKIRMQL